MLKCLQISGVFTVVNIVNDELHFTLRGRFFLELILKLNYDSFLNNCDLLSVTTFRWLDVQPFQRQVKHFLTDMSNRVEHEKLNQTRAELPFGWVFGLQLGLRQTHDCSKCSWWHFSSPYRLGLNQFLCLPKAELNTKINPNGQQPLAVWVRFGFQLDSLEKKWSA